MLDTPDRETRRTGHRTGLMLIGGELVEAAGGEWIDSFNPATEEYLGRVPRAREADIARAVDAARAAQPGWAALSMAQRAECLLRLADALALRAEEILHLEVADTGNTISPMRSDLVSAINRLRFFVGLGFELKGHSIPATPSNIHFTLREPYGVVGRILAFNHPIFFAVAGMAAPLMAGNTLIEKPSEQSPLSASILAEVAREIFPPGVFNIIFGLGQEAGEALVRHPKVKRVSFVGSARTGMAIQRAAAETAVKHVTLELGGKNPLIAFPDAPVEKVATAAVSGMNFGWQGQSCGSTSRVFLHEAIHDRVLEQIVAKVEKIRVGDPFDPRSEMGPMNSPAQMDKTMGYIEAGKSDGARVATGGGRPAGAAFERGYWVEPTVFAQVTPDMRIAREEIFGPVLSVLKFTDADDVVALANAVDYGLTAAIFTNDITRAMRTAKAIESGYVWVNGAGNHVPAMPYGGYKNSGIGRERGVEELLSYTEEKSVHIML